MNIVLDESIVLKDSGYQAREAVRVIVFDNENKIALYGSDYYLIPGGGVEGNESLIDACLRECLEEIGCKIKNINKIGISKEVKSKNALVQNAHYFTANLEGEKGNPLSTQSNELGRKIVWIKLEEAIELMKSYQSSISDKSYNSRFNIYSNLHFLEICSSKAKS